MATVKIVLIGPESTGKSTLAKQLAEHFKMPLVEEYAREYLEKKQSPIYNLADLEQIARTQVQRTQTTQESNPKLLFCDTDLVTIHIWSLDKFDKPIPFVEENLKGEKGDLYLLCKADITWENDPLREDSTRRDELFDWNRWVLESIDAKYCIISGEGSRRLEKAQKEVQAFLASCKK